MLPFSISLREMEKANAEKEKDSKRLKMKEILRVLKKKIVRFSWVLALEQNKLIFICIQLLASN